MTHDPHSGLDARDNLLWIAHQWPRLRAALQGTSGNALTGLPGATMTGGAVVVDVHVSDLLHAITKMTRYYADILLDEVPPEHGCDGACMAAQPPIPAERCPNRIDPITTSQMPRLLEQVAHRYGHFTTDPDLAIGFTEDAAEYRRKTENTLEHPDPPTYLGPCPADNCDGDLHARPGVNVASCPACGTETGLLEQRAWLGQRMGDRLMTATELGRALKILGAPVSPRTVWRWIERGKLVEETEPALAPPRLVRLGLYRLADAHGLAVAGRRRLDVAS